MCIVRSESEASIPLLFALHKRLDVILPNRAALDATTEIIFAASVTRTNPLHVDSASLGRQCGLLQHFGQ